MCSLCGVMGVDEHWSDAVARPGVFSRNVDSPSRRLERARRIAAANRILRAFGLTLSDWQGSAYLLATLTGKTEIVDQIGHLWPVADKLRGKACDPLDPDLIERMESLALG